MSNPTPASSTPTASVPALMPWGIVIASCFGMFAATASGSVRSPFLLDMATDLSASLPAIANLFGISSVAWGLSSYMAGALSYRLGRRMFLVGAPVLLSVSMAAAAFVSTYWAMVFLVVMASLGCGALTGVSMAEVSLRSPEALRGRALGWVMSGQSLTLLVGVPLAAWLGAIVGWRGVHIGLASLAAAAMVGLFFATRARVEKQAATSSGNGDQPQMTLRDALTGPVIRLFCALVCERVCFGMSAFYYPAYLRTAYELQVADVALPLVGFAIGNIVGTLLGGQLADRFEYKRVSFACAVVIAGLCAFPWFGWQPGLLITAAFGVAFAFFDALARTPLMASLAAVPAEVRGVIMGLNSSIASIGWLTAATVGGWLYAGSGFGAFGPLMLGLCITSALIVLKDTRLWRRGKSA